MDGRCLLYYCVLFLFAISKQSSVTSFEFTSFGGSLLHGDVRTFTKTVFQLFNVRYPYFSRQLPDFLGTEDTKHLGKF